MIAYLVRHGETYWNKKGILQGIPILIQIQISAIPLANLSEC